MKTKALVLSAMFVSLIMVATAFISIPIPFGYVHLGDAFIILACFFLKPKWSIPVSAIGSALADLLLGYYLYIPATLIIKACFATCFALFIHNKPTLVRNIIALLIGTLVIAFGYFIYESVLYGVVASIVNLPFNALQGACCGVVGGVLVQALSKVKAIETFRHS